MTKQVGKMLLQYAAAQSKMPLLRKLAALQVLHEFAITDGQTNKFMGLGMVSSSDPREHLLGTLVGLPQSVRTEYLGELLDEALEACGFPQCRADGSTVVVQPPLVGRYPYVVVSFTLKLPEDR